MITPEQGEQAEKQPYKYCVVGNIVKSHIDENGVLRYGTSAYTGGTKVFLCGKFWRISDKEIAVIGLTRGKKYQVHDVSVNLIENVRRSRTFRPWVLDIMNDYEFFDCWWHDKKEDRKETKEFVYIWNRKEELNRLKDCFEIMKVTSIYSASEYWWFMPDDTKVTFDDKNGYFLDPDKGKEYEVVEWLSDARVIVRPKQEYREQR